MSRQQQNYERLATLSNGYPSLHSPGNFNLEKYMEKDQSKQKRKASAWGRDDFKELIKENLKERNDE